MIRTIAELRAAADEELIAEHDNLTTYTEVGTKYYLDELNRRAAERSTEATNRLAYRMYVLTWVIAALTVVAAAATIIAIYS